jgi:uncharacterized spore protein YtfJ
MTTALEEGSTLADHLLQRIGSTVGDRANASTVFGQPVEREGITVIPVARARFAFGGGGGAGGRGGEEGSGGGGGGAAFVNPTGYIEVRDGAAHFRRISNPVDVLFVAIAASLAAVAARRLLARH